MGLCRDDCFKCAGFEVDFNLERWWRSERVKERRNTYARLCQAGSV